MKRAWKLAAAAVAASAIVTVAVLLVASHATTTSPPTRAAVTPRPPATAKTAPPAGGSSRSSASNPTPEAASIAFATSYAAYLDGGSSQLSAASITAGNEAQQAGRIPVSFRDGALRVTGETAIDSTCCSAEQTVTVANRQESYPFTVQLLDDGPHGWQVASLTAPDLSMDDHLQPVKHDGQPASSGREAARQFALAYTAFKAGTGPEPLMTATARRELAAGQDSLAGAEIPKGSARLTSIAFGPPTGNEFAATASVKVANTTHMFTFLLTLDHGQWAAGAFL